MEKWKAAQVAESRNNKNEKRMKKTLLATSITFTPFSVFAASEQVSFTFPSLVAGMLLVSWFITIIQSNNVINRLLELLLGVTALAILSTDSVIAIGIAGLILLAELAFAYQKRWHRASVWLNGLSLVLFIIAAALFFAEQLAVVWPALIIVVHFLAVSMYMMFRKNASLKLALASRDKTNSAHQTKQLLIERGIFLARYEKWRKSSLNKVVILLKLDGLAKLNRMVGHDFGDLLIAKLGRKINEELTHEDVMSVEIYDEAVHLCYLGGVDFVFAVDLNTEAHLHQKLVHRIHNIVSRPTHIENIDSEAELRVAIVEDKGQMSGQQLLSKAFLAIEQANDIEWQVTFDNTISEQAERRKTILSDLTGLDFDKDFQLYFHPVVELATNKVLFVELLLRWHHPKFGTLEAKDFVEQINAAGLMLSIAHWVSEKAAELAMAIKLEEINVPVSINLFGKELLQDEFIDHLAEMLTEHRLGEGDIIIESPANVFMGLPDFGESILTRLKENNIAVCLDDLGIEPLQLSKLPRLALNYAKVDGSIVKELSDNVNTRSLLSGIIDMGNSLGINVVCEGIESETQYTYISAMKCHAAQGYLFSRPLPTVGLLGWLKQWQKKLANGERPY